MSAPEPRASGAPSANEEGGARVARRILGGVLLGLAAYALLALWADAASVGRALADFPLALVPAAMALSFANYAVRFVRWELYRTQLGIRLDRKTSFLIHLSGLALTVSPGKMGEAFKSWLVRRVDGTPVATSAPIVVAERFTDLLGFLVLIAIGGLATAPEYAWVFWATFALCAALLAFVAWSPASAFALAIARRLPVVRRFAPKLEEALGSTRTLLAPSRIPLPTALATFGWALECTAFWLVASALVPGGVPFLFAVYTFALAAVAGAVAIVFPGGLGITEASMTALLSRRYAALGLPLELAHSKAAAATLVIRLCTLWFAVLLGVVAVVLFERRWRSISSRAGAR
ncbi:MAG: flippase-like domain-containing protein [Planctomycetes bacterium]|nr:flippase-like domain-containing protein [Planctomycetota bacterium]